MRSIFFHCLCLGFCLSFPLFLRGEKSIPPEISLPWLTGPLLAPSSNVVPWSHINIEPYLYVTNTVGRYSNSWHASRNPTRLALAWQSSIQIGLSSSLDCQFTPSFTYNHVSGAADWVVNDFPLLIDIQLLTESEEKGSLRPSIKFTLGESFPLGKYQHLDPKKNFTDSGGSGSYTTFCGLTFGKLFYLEGPHFLNLRVNVSYQHPAPVHIEGLSSYGGGGETNGTMYPAQTISFDGAFEYTFTTHWALACDLVGLWGSKPHFSGTLGKGASFVSTHSSVQISLAPAIEYNWNDALGIIIGPWFTLAGKNSLEFYSGVIAFNYYY